MKLVYSLMSLCPRTQTLVVTLYQDTTFIQYMVMTHFRMNNFLIH